MESIARGDIEAILAPHAGTHMFAQALRHSASDADLLRLLGRYIQFNAAFGSGVATLAGALAARQDLFRDPDEVGEVLADRSVEVAANIFYAAIEEFGVPSTTSRSTHRALAQATLKAAGGFFGYPPARLTEVVCLNPATRAAIRHVREGYGSVQAGDACTLMRAIGFHVGSERLADEEFGVLDRFLRATHPKLVESLEGTEVAIGGVQQPAYLWIGVHTRVEAEHFEWAVLGAKQALRYYTGPERPAQLKGWILDGCRRFGDVQKAFMAGLRVASTTEEHPTEQRRT
jgi:hypothetical protein